MTVTEPLPLDPLIIDLDAPDLVEPPPIGLDRCVIAHTHASAVTEPGTRRDRWIEHSTLTLTTHNTPDTRCVPVDSMRDTLASLTHGIRSAPIAAHTCADVLLAATGKDGTLAGLVTESLAYSTLQAGPEFHTWLTGRHPTPHTQTDPVLLTRHHNHLDAAFNRPDRHNAFSNALRAGLLDALTLALIDHTITSFTLRGHGPSFCSGGDLTEFGLLTDPATAHLARTRHSPALLIDRLTHRLGDRAAAHVHGAVLGSGLEMAAFFGHVVADPDTVFGLPELALGLLPGAGGTVSIPRRIGRHRTAYLVLSGRRIDSATALAWGLVDAIAPIDDD